MKAKISSCTPNENKGLLPPKGYWAECFWDKKGRLFSERGKIHFLLACGWANFRVSTWWMNGLWNLQMCLWGYISRWNCHSPDPSDQICWHGFLDGFQDKRTFACVVSGKCQIPCAGGGKPVTHQEHRRAALPAENFETSLAVSFTIFLYLQALSLYRMALSFSLPSPLLCWGIKNVPIKGRCLSWGGPQGLMHIQPNLTSLAQNSRHATYIW